MAITIDGITLPDLVMENEFSRSMVEARTARTLGGKMNIWEQAVSGRNIDLAGGDDFGLITREVLQQLLDLSAAANAFYILSYEGGGLHRPVSARGRGPDRGDAGCGQAESGGWGLV